MKTSRLPRPPDLKNHKKNRKNNLTLPAIFQTNNNTKNSDQLIFKKKSGKVKPVSLLLPSINRVVMTKSYALNIKNAQDYTCHRLKNNGSRSNSADLIELEFCGECSSCQIIDKLNTLKQWFDRAGQSTIMKFLIGLVNRINNLKILNHLNDLLRPLSESKDIVYARNKYLPSCNEDQSKSLSNNRCLDSDYVRKQILDTWQWYSVSSNYIKLNFMLSLLNKCDQPAIHEITIKVKLILEKYGSLINQTPLQTSSHVYAKLNGEDVDAELVCEAYDNEEGAFEDVDKEIMNIFRDSNEESTGEKHVDFIRQLPVHLSKLILNSLSKKCLYNSMLVSKYWCNLIKEVHKSSFLKKIKTDDIMLLKGISSKACNPKYASNTDVKVPNLLPGTNELVRRDDEPEVNIMFKTECSWLNAYAGFSTRNIIMEERNLFCGSYNVLLLKEKRDPHRVIHFNNGANLVAFGSFDKKIRFLDIKTASERSSTIKGHAGSIKCIYICELKKIVLTGSFDTSIRCWSIETGKCIRIFQGHQQTVTCLSMFDEDERIVSGSNDNTCRGILDFA